MPEYWALERTLSDREIDRLLRACDETRYPERNRAILLLTTDAGLTPREIAWLRRYCVQDDDGLPADRIDLSGKPGSKLKARRIPLAAKGRLRRMIIACLKSFPGSPNDPLIISERAFFDYSPGVAVSEMKSTSIGYVLWKLAERSGVEMSGGRDGRRTFIAKAGRALRKSGGSAKDVQSLAGHRSIASTQDLLDADWKAQQRAIGTLFNDKI